MVAGRGATGVLAQPSAGKYPGALLGRAPQSRAEQDELPLQTRVSDVRVTPLLGTDPVRSVGGPARGLRAFADSLVSLQALILAEGSTAQQG